MTVTPADESVFHATARKLSVPRRDPASSFVLHAPLELLARLALWPRVDEAARPRATMRVEALGAQYQSDPPVLREPNASYADPAEAARVLLEAVGNGDLDSADDGAAWLGAHATAAELVSGLGDTIVASTAAAGHAPIFLDLAGRADAPGAEFVRMLRPLARELARHPDWGIDWIDNVGGRPVAASATGRTLRDALDAVPLPDNPEGRFIFPTMAAVDSSADGVGVAEKLLVGAIPSDIEAARRAIVGFAVAAMLAEPATFAAYGWTHCLTMPLAVLALAPRLRDPARAVAVAATHVVGFRSTMATCPAEWKLPPRTGATVADVRAAIDSGEPDEAARRAASVDDDALDELGSLLATRAALAYDAHLVKYTVACLQVVAGHPAEARRTLAAAAKLHAWWSANPDPNDPTPGS